MASRKLVRDLFLSRQTLFRNLITPQQISGLRSRRMVLSEGYVREFSVFNEFSKRIKGEASNNPEFQKSVKKLKDKAEELKGVKEDFKVRTKQSTEQLYKRVDDVWTEAEAAAKKVSANVKEKISAAKEDVKETFQFGKQSSSESSNASGKSSTDGKDASGTASGEGKHQESSSSESGENLFGNFRSGVSSASSKVSMAMQKMKEAKVIDFAKKGYDIVKEELTSNPSRRHHLHPEAPSSTTVERSTRTDVVAVPIKQSPWRKKWETLKEKMRQNPMFKRISEPVVTKSQEIVEDAREIWETSDNPVVHKIQDINESVFGETATAISFKEIRRHDPSFSLPEFVAQVQEITGPVVQAYMKGDTEILKKYCSPEVIERCKAERQAWESQGVFFDNKLLHISDLEVLETRLLGESPIIVLRFQTQQIHCIRDRHGAVTEGGKDTIHTVVYAWAMQQVDPEELGNGAIYPIWRLREVQQMGWQALI